MFPWEGSNAERHRASPAVRRVDLDQGRDFLSLIRLRRIPWLFREGPRRRRWLLMRLTRASWEVEQHVMQSRSVRRSGQPSYPDVYSNACLRLGPARRALGPAATPAASTRRTRNRDRSLV